MVQISSNLRKPPSKSCESSTTVYERLTCEEARVLSRNLACSRRRSKPLLALGLPPYDESERHSDGNNRIVVICENAH